MADYDPFASSDPFANADPFGGGRPPPKYPALPPEQSSSLIGDLAGAGLSGIGYVASLLDKPGRAIRGVLGGHPEELAAAIPFSDTLGLSNPENMVTGRDLTNQIGLTDKGDEGWIPWGLGLGAEVATDPLTYLNPLGGFNKAGQALSKMGAMPKGYKAMLAGVHALEPELEAAGRAAGKTPDVIAAEIRHLRDQGKWVATRPEIEAAVAADPSLRKYGDLVGKPLGGTIAASLPFGDPFFTAGTGPLAQKYGAALDKAGEFLKYKVPGVKTLAALFDPNARGAVDEVTQRASREAYTPAFKTGQAAAREQEHALIGVLDPIAGTPHEVEALKLSRQTAEGVPLDTATHPGAQATGQEAGRLASEISAQRLSEARAAGAPLPKLEDEFVQYAPRDVLAADPRAKSLEKGRLYPTKGATSLARKDVFRNVPGGTEQINKWVIDPELSGPARTLAPKDVAAKIKEDMLSQAQRGGQVPGTGVPWAPTALQDFEDMLTAKSRQLASRLKKLNPRHAEESIPLFGPDIVRDIARAGDIHARTMATPEAIYHAIGQTAQPIGQLGGDAVPVSRLLRRIGLQSTTNAATGLPEGAAVRAYRALAGQGAGPWEAVLSGVKPGQEVSALTKALGQWGIPTEQANQILKQYNRWVTPEPIKAPLKGLDSITNLFKALTYPIWPAAHARNVASGVAANAPLGASIRHYADQYRLMRGLPIVNPERYGVPAGLTAAEQIDHLRKRQYAAANIFGGHNAATDIAGAEAAALAGGDRIVKPLPGSDRVGQSGSFLGDTGQMLRESMQDRGLGSPLNPLGVSGVGGRQVDTFAPVVAGRQVGTNIEDWLRGSGFLAQLERGVSDATAAAGVNRVHFDYKDLTEFEKAWMKRLFPFYTYTRKNLPLQLSYLAQQPGNVTPYLRAASNARGQGYTPQYLSSGIAIPMGQEEGGKQRYLSQLGLPVEEALEHLKFSGGLPDVPKTLLDYAGMSNPLIKAPLEQLSGIQFHTGRRLADLRPTGVASQIGALIHEDNPQLIAQILANTPVTRFVTAADKAMDERKPLWARALNLASGARITDVDTVASREIEARRQLEEMMDQSPRIARSTDFYVKPEDAQALTPQEMIDLRLYAEMKKHASAAAEAKRRQQQAIGVFGP